MSTEERPGAQGLATDPSPRLTFSGSCHGIAAPGEVRCVRHVDGCDAPMRCQAALSQAR